MFPETVPSGLTPGERAGTEGEYSGPKGCQVAKRQGTLDHDLLSIEKSSDQS